MTWGIKLAPASTHSPCPTCLASVLAQYYIDMGSASLNCIPQSLRNSTAQLHALQHMRPAVLCHTTHVSRRLRYCHTTLRTSHSTTEGQCMCSCKISNMFIRQRISLGTATFHIQILAWLCRRWPYSHQTRTLLRLVDSGMEAEIKLVSFGSHWAGSYMPNIYILIGVEFKLFSSWVCPEHNLISTNKWLFNLG